MDFGWNPAGQLAGIVLNHSAGTTSQSGIIELSYTVLEFAIESDDEQRFLHHIGNTLEVFEDLELAPYAPDGGPYERSRWIDHRNVLLVFNHSVPAGSTGGAAS